MLGDRHQDRKTEEPLTVDANLEQDLFSVERCVQAYLEDGTEHRRQELLTALEQLDDQTQSSDAFSENVLGSGALGYATKFSVIGETNTNPIAEEVPAAVFQAQIALVKAAKVAVAGQTVGGLAELHEANSALAGARAETESGR
jgi:hypothetical protein